MEGSAMGKVIAVVSGKGGTGKTTTTGALGSCLAVMGYKTLCVDCDVGLRNLDMNLGMTDNAVLDFSDVISGEIELTKACSAHKKIENLYFLSCPAVGTVQDYDRDTMIKLAEQARESFDFCLMDSAAGIGSGFMLASGAADGAIIVTTGDNAGIRDAARVAQELVGLDIKNIYLIVNRISRRRFRESGLTVDDIIDTVGVQLIGVIFEDDDVSLAANDDTPLVLYKRRGASKQYLRAAQRFASNFK